MCTIGHGSHLRTLRFLVEDTEEAPSLVEHQGVRILTSGRNPGST